MAAPTDKYLRSDIAEILKDADLTTLSSKKIRKQLEEKYGLDLTERKTAIDKMIMEMLTLEQTRQSSASRSKSGSSSVSSKDTSRNRTENGGEDSESQDDAESNDDSDLHNESPIKKRAKIEKKSRKRSPSEDDSDEKDENSELDDEDIARQLQEEEHKAVRKTRGSAKPEKEKKKTSRGKQEPGSSRKTNKYTEPCYLSPQLAAIMGESRLKRSDVVKKMWAIVKERNLYDPRDKRYMICDAEMQSVFGCKKVQIFGMMKYLKHHITSPDDVVRTE